ncbi:hypothetical protein M3Y95_00089000 [Aphelenchoides besseyi]|nr:hypothetical protein M3Y95_00089000 [Aphelenchoides besseyi]
MGATHSYPASNSRAFRPYNQFGSTTSFQYRAEALPSKRVASEQQRKPRNCDVNNNRPLSTSTITSKSVMNSSTKKHHSALSCGWSLAKRTAAAALPSFLNTNSTVGHLKGSSAHDIAVRSPVRESSSVHVNSNESKNEVSSRTSKSRSSNTRESTGETNHCQMDQLNHNDYHVPTEQMGYEANQSLGKLQRSQSPRSQENLTVYTNMYSIAEEYRNSVDFIFDEQDLTNNNAGRKWIVDETPPRRVPRFFNRLMQLNNNNNEESNYRRKQHRASTKPTPSMSCSSSAASTSSGSASSYSIFSSSTANVTVPSYPEDDRDDELPIGVSGGLESRLDCSLRTLFSQHSFISPSESLDGNDFHNATFNRNDIVSSSTAELLRGLGRFVSENCKVPQFEPAQLVMWLRSIDRSLMMQGWQEIAFVSPPNLVFVYLLIRAQLNREYHKIRTVNELQSLVRTCLYVSYAYMGNEISYPLKPFISQNENRSKFWSRCLQLINLHSDEMLRLNSSTEFFLDVFDELRSYAEMERCC